MCLVSHTFFLDKKSGESILSKNGAGIGDQLYELNVMEVQNNRKRTMGIFRQTGTVLYKGVVWVQLKYGT